MLPPAALLRLTVQEQDMQPMQVRNEHGDVMTVDAADVEFWRERGWVPVED